MREALNHLVQHARSATSSSPATVPKLRESVDFDTEEYDMNDGVLAGACAHQEQYEQGIAAAVDAHTALVRPGAAAADAPLRDPSARAAERNERFQALAEGAATGAEELETLGVRNSCRTSRRGWQHAAFAAASGGLPPMRFFTAAEVSALVPVATIQYRASVQPHMDGRAPPPAHAPQPRRGAPPATVWASGSRWDASLPAGALAILGGGCADESGVRRRAQRRTRAHHRRRPRQCAGGGC
mmetsp:Transcript_11995/g.39456  ORF Transcript_11995/g.39456 Transcript_11995/m.39456 type:complete len:242 (+) Transcript_11995:596-1321(+)